MQIMCEVIQRGSCNTTCEENDEIACHTIERIVELPLEEVGEYQKKDEAHNKHGIYDQIVEERFGC